MIPLYVCVCLLSVKLETGHWMVIGEVFGTMV